MCVCVCVCGKYAGPISLHSQCTQLTSPPEKGPKMTGMTKWRGQGSQKQGDISHLPTVFSLFPFIHSAMTSRVSTAGGGVSRKSIMAMSLLPSPKRRAETGDISSLFRFLVLDSCHPSSVSPSIPYHHHLIFLSLTESQHLPSTRSTSQQQQQVGISSSTTQYITPGKRKRGRTKKWEGQQSATVNPSLITPTWTLLAMTSEMSKCPRWMGWRSGAARICGGISLVRLFFTFPFLFV